MRVLIVDDEQAILRVCQRGLARRHHVTIADGGRAAVALLVEDGSRFDVIVCDLGMPDFDGVELYHYVAEHFPKLARRFVFFTGDSHAARAQQLLQRIGNPCLDKPFTPAALERVITEAFERSSE
jgi:CheY-like chemotaxis protein